jgi:hypothetical protein
MINQKQSLIAIRLGFLRAMSSLYPLEDLAYSSHQHVVSPFIISASDNEEEDGLQKHRFGMLTWTKYGYRCRHVCRASERGGKHP